MLLAAVVAINFIVTPLYHPGGDEPFTVWEILNWFMAVGMVIALAASYVEKRRVDGDGSAGSATWKRTQFSTLLPRCSSSSSGTGLAHYLPTTSPTVNIDLFVKTPRQPGARWG